MTDVGFVDAELLHSYRNGGYQVRLYDDGTKIREEIDASLPPIFNEQMDLKITDYCDAGCAWCHEKSTKAGRHGDVDRTIELLKDLPAGVEVAIGGGDPLSHPQFERFVRSLRDLGLVPSVTVNGRHFDRHRSTLERLIEQGKLFGVGISYHQEIPRWNYKHMVLHLITGVNHPAVLDAAPTGTKVLVLGYKQFGRGAKLFEVRPRQIQENIAAWYRELFVVAHKHHLSFDNLAIQQLKPERVFRDKAAYQRQYMGPEGEFSCYLDAVEQTFALSSYSEHRAPWTNMQDMFARVRESQGFSSAQRPRMTEGR